MATQPDGRPRRPSAHREGGVRPVRSRKFSRGPGAWTVRHATPVLVAVTLCLTLVGGFLAFRLVSEHADREVVPGGVATSFGALWVDSFKEIVLPQIVRKGHIGVPVAGDPEKVSLEVALRLANTTPAQVRLTPADFALRLGPDEASIPVDGATFESVNLLPGAVFDARLQFPVSGGEHRLVLLFDDPGTSEVLLVDLGYGRFQEARDDRGQHH